MKVNYVAVHAFDIVSRRILFQVKKRLPLNCTEREFVNWNMELQLIAGRDVVKFGNEPNACTTKCKPICRWPEIAYTF